MSARAGQAPAVFRRRRVAPRRRRRSPLLALARPFFGAVAAVVAPTGLAWWVLTTPALLLREVEVVGAGRIGAAWVEEAVAPIRGRHLLRLSLPEVRERLERHPWVGGAEVEKRLPDRLRVRIVERRPAALLNRGGELAYVDREGELIAPFEPGATAAERPVDLLLLSGSTEAARLAAGLEVAAAFAALAPEWSAGLSEIEVLPGEGFRLFTAALPFPLVVRSETLGPGVRGLDRFLEDILARYRAVAAVDLRFARRIVVVLVGLLNPGGARHAEAG